MTPDQQYLFTGDAYGFHRWDITRGIQTQFRARDDIDKDDKGDKNVWSLSLTGDGALVVTTAWGQNAAILWDVATGQELQRFIAEDNVRSVAIDPAGRYIVTGSLHGTAILWDVASGERLHTFDGHSHTVMSVLLLADRDRLITGSSDGTARLWELSSGKELKRFVGHEADVVAMALTADGRQLITDSWDGTARLWDVEKEEEIRRFPGHGTGYAPGRLLFINNGRQLITGDVNGVLRLWDTVNFQEIKRFQGHSEEITWLEISSDERYLITSSLDGTVRIWDLSRGLELCSLVSFNQGSWVVVATDGRFDTDQLDEILGLQWILPDEPLRTYALELFMRDYYEPSLLSRLLGGEVFAPIRPLTDLNRIQPDVSLISVIPEPCTPQPCVPETVAVTVEVKANEQASGESVQQQSRLTDVYDLRLFRNGQLIAYLPKDRNEMRELSVSTQTDTTQEFNQWRAEHKLSLDPKTQSRRITFEHIRLPRLAELDAVEFSAYAFNEDRVKSATARIRCVVSDKEPARSTEGECVLAQPKVRKGRAYVIAVGVNAYENNTWDLKYAAKDAHKLLAVIPPLLEATQEYAAVVPIGLIADWEVVNKQRLVSQQAATKARFKAVLDILANREVDPVMRASIPHVEQLQRAQPEDLVLISYSSHGYADTSGMFYLFPYDIGGKVSKQTMSTLLTRTISSDELSAWLRDVDAGEFVLIIDACHSAASVEGTGFKPGPMGARGLGQLAYDKGMRILASTRADDMALESPMIQQGLLSYVLVEDGLIKQRADFAPTDQLIVMKEWLNYSVQRVPELYAQLLQGDVRGVEGEQMRLTSFQRGVAMYYEIDKARAERTRQQPKLFDFRRAPAYEVVLTQFAK